MAVKFDKFKKDVLAAVLKMNQSQDATNISDIRTQLAEIKVLVRDLEALENYYTKEEIDENHYNKSEIDSKTETLTNLTTMLNGSVGSMSRRLSGLETNLSDILPTVNRLNAIDHTQFITARDVSDEYDIDPSEYNIDILDGYATQDYVDRAIAKIVSSAPEALDTLKELSDALGNDANFATTITNALANKADKSEIPEEYDDSELVSRIETLENNPATDSTIIDRIEELESKPFDKYLVEDDAKIISASLNDLNDKITHVQNSQIMSNEMDQRLSELEQKPFDQYLKDEDGEVIATALVDLNNRLSDLENNCVITENNGA